MVRSLRMVSLLALAVVALGAPPAFGAFFTVALQPLNGSGVTGTAVLELAGDELTVQLLAIGLEPGQTHPQHIHGLTSDGAAVDSTVPTLAEDADGDGYIEVGEGAATYGPVILPLTPFPTAPAGFVSYKETFSLDAAMLAELTPLEKRVLVLHGMTVPVGDGAGTGGEVDGTGGYKALLPIAAGEIVPEPATLVLLVFGGAGVLWRRKLR